MGAGLFAAKLCSESRGVKSKNEVMMVEKVETSLCLAGEECAVPDWTRLDN